MLDSTALQSNPELSELSARLTLLHKVSRAFLIPALVPLRKGMGKVSAMKQLFQAIFQHLTNFIKSVLSALLGVNEIIFLLGMGALFYGLQGQYSFYVALIVCGALLVVISIGGILFASKADRR